jgi:hypothetical protein
LERFGQILKRFSRKELHMMIRISWLVREWVRMRATLAGLPQIDHGRHLCCRKCVHGVSVNCMGGIAPPKNIPGSLSAFMAVKTP